MKAKLSSVEQEILQALLNTHRTDAQMYLDLRHVLPDLHPEQVESGLNLLGKKHLIHYLNTKDKHHLLARITIQGINVLEEEGISTGLIAKNKRILAYIGIFLIALFFGLTLGGAIPTGIFKGEITGLGVETLSADAKEYIRVWIEEQLEQDDDNYTFDVLNPREKGPIRTFLIQCKSEAKHLCTYPIVMMEMDETTGEILNVEYPKE
jgi:hypothetical protein